MENVTLTPIGRIAVRDDETVIELDDKYIPALTGLDGFSHIQVLWWFSGCDDPASRGQLIERKPYKKGPGALGAFATRSPRRPNPIALTSSYVTYIDRERGVIGLAYIDADDGTPVLDVKPYTPSLDRVQSATVPDWCAHWPACAEASGDFDWSREFNF